MLASSANFSLLFLGLILIVDEGKVSVAISCRSILRMTGLLSQVIYSGAVLGRFGSFML